MLLNHIERVMMNNALREAIQRRFEARMLLRMGGKMSGTLALEVGCGRGVGVQIILKEFGAQRVHAFDLDPRMIDVAKRRLVSCADQVEVRVGDATAIDAADSTYDAVFDFGIVHHIPRWRHAIREIARVLKPGGRFYAEEVLARFVTNAFWRKVLQHPQQDRFGSSDFRVALEDAGLRVIATRDLAGNFAWFVADKPHD